MREIWNESGAVGSGHAFSISERKQPEVAVARLFGGSRRDAGVPLDEREDAKTTPIRMRAYESEVQLALAARTPVEYFDDDCVETAPSGTPPLWAIAGVEIGDVIGHYRIERVLGVGGMGTVLLGRHTILDKLQVAIKMLLPEVSHNQDIVRRFFNEAHTVSSVDHVGIVKVFDFGYHADRSAYIVMEHLSGESLSGYLKLHRRIPLAHTLCIGRQIAEALYAAHGCGVIHRDLKPGNVFLCPDANFDCGARVKIIDFGVAKLLTPDGINPLHTRAGIVVGTPSYMAPEQCSDREPVDHRADVYSLGCLLFRILCGRPPFRATSAIDIMTAHRQKAPPRIRDFDPMVPPQVEAIILRALSKSPDDRFASMREFAAALKALLDAYPAPRDDGGLSERIRVAPAEPLASGTPLGSRSGVRDEAASDEVMISNHPNTGGDAGGGQSADGSIEISLDSDGEPDSDGEGDGDGDSGEYSDGSEAQREPQDDGSVAASAMAVLDRTGERACTEVDFGACDIAQWYDSEITDDISPELHAGRSWFSSVVWAGLWLIPLALVILYLSYWPQ